MKKKIIGVIVFLIGTLGTMYLMGVFDKTKATEEEIIESKEIGDNQEMNDALDNAEMPEGFEEDTTELDLGLDEEEFDPEAML